MWQYKLHPPHLINIATLPCESQNTENVILRQDITKELLHQMYHSFIKVDQSHHVLYIYLFGVLYSKACVKQRFMTSTRPAKMLDPNLFWLWPEHHPCWRDHLRSCVHAGGGQFECMLWPECSLMWFARTFLWNCQCNLMHVTAIL